jgi:hypothetical protein
MTKPYHLMTPAERLADRIAKNREIDRRVSDRKEEPRPVAKRRSSSESLPRSTNNAFDRFQEIKRRQGIDAASEFIHERVKTAE